MTEACDLMPAFPIRIRRAGAAQILIIVVVLSLVLLYNLRSASGWASPTGPGEDVDSSTATAVATSAVSVPSKTPLQSSPRREKELVVASLDSEDVSWLYNNITDWAKNIYVVNNPAANLTVPVNKGRESMAYLTYDIHTSVFSAPYLDYLGLACPQRSTSLDVAQADS